MQHKIVLIGGPGTGKTSVLKELIKREFCCMPEISREVTLKAKQQGIDQLFLSKPLLFSEMLLKGREAQFILADKKDANVVFFDRGIPDVFAYMDYFKTKYPSIFIEKSKQYKYTQVFHFSPWEDIYQTDNERYESFKESEQIDKFLVNAYKKLGYVITFVPFGSLKDRTNYILNSLNCEL